MGFRLEILGKDSYLRQTVAREYLKGNVALHIVATAN